MFRSNSKVEAKDFTFQSTPLFICTTYGLSENLALLSSQQFDLGLGEDGIMHFLAIGICHKRFLFYELGYDISEKLSSLWYM